MELFVTMGHHTDDIWCSTERPQPVLVWAGVLRPGPASALPLLSAWIPLLSGPALSAQLSRARRLKSPFITNTAALTPRQDPGTQPSHTKERKTGAQPAPKAGGMTSE